MKNPLISILIPFKNTSNFLPECLNSIINQTYTNWELLIVDDNSTDNSFEIVTTYTEKDSRIKLYKNSGNGIIEALRLAFKHSKGEYITRMDSDDIMHAEKLQVMLSQLLDSGKQHIALGLVKYFRETGVGDGFMKYEKWLNSLTVTGNNYSEIYKECVIPSPCWMLHRDDFIACGGFSPNRYPEDYDLAFRFYKHNFKCIPSNKILHYWRDYSTRASRTDDNYKQEKLLDIKLHYFLKLDYNPQRTLTVWGAGGKGKRIAKQLVEQEIPFVWICDNPRKIGKYIYNQKLYNFNHLKELNNPQSIVTVANQNAQREIKDYFKTQNMESMIDYFFFC